MHAFERAGLGVAPFRCAGMSEKVYVAFPGAPAQPAGTCDYCGNGIRYCCHIKDSSGKEFIVGTDCVMKVNAENNVAGATGVKAEMQKKQAARRRELAEEKRVARREAWAAEKVAKEAAERDANGGKTLAEIESERKAEEALDSRRKYTEENAWLYSVLEEQQGNFCWSISQDLRKKPVSAFPARAISIMRDVFAKTFGRGGSSAYNKAVSIFNENAGL